MRSAGRTAHLYLLVVFSSYLLLEATSLLALLVLQAAKPTLFERGFVDAHFDSITEDYREKYVANAHDQLLGWDSHPETEYEKKNLIDETYVVSFGVDGSRVDDLPEKKLLINTYGDSFTLCEEVGDHQTWQYFLETQLGYEVKNFGVSGYGTHQAVLKLARHLEQGNVAPISILGIMEENLNRVVNSFRPFYYRKTGVKLGFKPYLRLSAAGQVEGILNPYQQTDLSLDELRTLAHELSGTEYWNAHAGNLEIKYSFVLRLTKAVSFFVARKIRHWSGEAAYGRSGTNLWETEEGNTVINFLVDRFVELTTGAGSIPVLLLIPIDSSFEHTEPPGYSRFKDQVRERHPIIVVIDLADNEFDRKRFHVSPYRGHASEYGNRVIASIIAQAYRKTATDRELILPMTW